MRLAGLGMVALLGLTSCSESGPSDEALRMLDDPTPTAEATPDGDGAAEPVAEDAPFPRECRDVISFVRVTEIVASPMRGASGVYQDDFPDSPRVERLVCQYGTEDPDDADDDAEPREDPAVSVIVSSYVDAAAAAAQVELTVDNARVGGRTIDELAIAGREVTSLSSSDAVSYVLADGELTYVVTLAGDVVPPEAGQVVLLALVEELLGEPTTS